MAFERPTLQVIYNRIVNDMETRLVAANPDLEQVKIKPVSLLGILAIVIAGAVHMLYGLLLYLSRQIFPDTADEEWLIRNGEMRNYPMNPATYASGIAEFTGTEGVVIPSGTEVQTVTGVKYATTEAITISSGVASATVLATEYGVNGNTTLTALTLTSPIPGIASAATFTSLPSGGADIEPIEDYRERLINYIQTPPSGGRAYDYELWAKSVPGIGQAWAYDVYNGPGTVGVIVANEGLPVSSGLIQEVKDYIAERRPLGSVVYVENVDPAIVDLVIFIPITEYSKQTLITEQLEQLFDDKAEPGEPILLSNINASILASTVSDYSIYSIYVDGAPQPIANIQPGGTSLLNLRSVNFGPLT